MITDLDKNKRSIGFQTDAAGSTAEERHIAVGWGNEDNLRPEEVLNEGAERNRAGAGPGMQSGDQARKLVLNNEKQDDK